MGRRKSFWTSCSVILKRMQAEEEIAREEIIYPNTSHIFKDLPRRDENYNEIEYKLEYKVPENYKLKEEEE